MKNGDGYVSHSVYRPALGLALWLGCIPRGGWVDPPADHSGCHFLDRPLGAGPKGLEVKRSLEPQVAGEGKVTDEAELNSERRSVRLKERATWQKK